MTPEPKAVVVDAAELDATGLERALLPYRWALAELRTRLESMRDDLRVNHGSDAIDHIRSRVKTPESIRAKLARGGLAVTEENIAAELRDVAGIRVIAPFARDITFLVELLRARPDFRVVAEKDYISGPKSSGYRSYHLIIEVPVTCGGEVRAVPVEMQIRTEAMNFWASLEHKVRYKYSGDIPAHLADELVSVADKAAELDERMALIHEIVSLINA